MPYAHLVRANAALTETAVSATSSREALEQIFTRVIQMSTGAGVRRGCFSVNSAIELAPHAPVVREQLRQNTVQKEATIVGIIRQGIKDGSLGSQLKPEVAASYATTVMNGLQVRGKLGLTQ